MRLIDQRGGEGHAMAAVLVAVVGDGEACRFIEAAGEWEKRRGLAVFPQLQDDEVEARQRSAGDAEECPHPLFVGARRPVRVGEPRWRRMEMLPRSRKARENVVSAARRGCPIASPMRALVGGEEVALTPGKVGLFESLEDAGG